MSKLSNYKGLIKAVAMECGYEIVGSDSVFEIYTDFEHPISFQVKENSEGYLQVHIWEDAHKRERNHQYGKARYSLRTAIDVVQFCNILNSSYSLRARRLEE
jgi:hypothetical protein